MIDESVLRVATRSSTRKDEVESGRSRKKKNEKERH